MILLTTFHLFTRQFSRVRSKISFDFVDLCFFRSTELVFTHMPEKSAFLKKENILSCL